MAPMTARSAAQSLLTLVAVLLVAAASLAGLDRLGQALEASRTVQVVATVADAERLVGRRRLALPAYFPSSLRWPPQSVRVWPVSRVVVLGLAARPGEPVAMELAQAVDEGQPVPREALAPLVPLATREVTLGGAPATLTRGLGAEGAAWVELAWTLGGRAVVLRSRGSEEQALKMAASLRVEAHD